MLGPALLQLLNRQGSHVGGGNWVGGASGKRRGKLLGPPAGASGLEHRALTNNPVKAGGHDVFPVSWKLRLVSCADAPPDHARHCGVAQCLCYHRNAMAELNT